MPKWIVGLPGGPAGPFYSVVSQTGEIIVLQAGSKERANLIAKLGAILDCNFYTVHEAGIRLREIMTRDFPDSAPDERPIDEGSEDYIIRSVIEALFG